ncbi:hypothetical protein V3C99_010105 [Haemonchus contortus]
MVGCLRKLVEIVVNEPSGQGRRLLMGKMVLVDVEFDRWLLQVGYGSMRKSRSSQRRRVQHQCQSQHHVSLCKRSSGQQLVVKER